MNDSVHHIRLLAGLEIDPGHGNAITRTLDRHQADTLASHLAGDLHRAVPEVETTMLVTAGTLLEPGEMIRPGFPAWAGLEELAETTLRERGFGARILAIGAHAGRLPHRDLQPPDTPPQGRFLALPITLICPQEQAVDLKARLESSLFERASLDPPARALLSEATGLDSVHGHLLTLADLIALQHVQLDGAGLGGFWPVVEQSLVDPDQAASHELPGGLTASWQPAQGRVTIDFFSFDQFDGDIDAYALWQRAFRTLTALLDNHAVDWRARPSDPVVADGHNATLVEPAGRFQAADGITVQHHPDVGLLAWSVVEDGRLIHVYPLNAESVNRVMNDFAERGLHRFDDRHRVHHDPESGKLLPANDPATDSTTP